jgi:hypothetical protein
MLHFIGSLAALSRVKWRGTSEQEIAMLKKLAVLAAGLALSAPVLADGRNHDRHHGHHKHYWKHQHRPVVVVPRVAYTPAPVYYYAPPPRIYYAPPPRVYYAPPPADYGPPLQSGISVRLHFPL